VPNYPTAQQLSAVYTLRSGIDSSLEAVINDPTDADYVGSLNGGDSITGLDSPEMRNAIYEMVETDGAILGPQYHGHRPITMNVTIQGSTVTERNQREAKLRRVINDCAQATGSLRWTPDGSIEQYLQVRKHQPFRIKGGYVKEGMVSLVAGFPWIQSWAQRSVSGNHNTDHTAENQGDAWAPPERIRVNGPGTGPRVRRTISAVSLDLDFPTLTLPAGQYIDIDTWNKTVTHSSGANYYSYLDLTASTWFTMGPGNNTFRVDWDSGATTASDIEVYWRDSWL
jgi:hypothetical protein